MPLTSKRVARLVRHSPGRHHDGHGLYLQVVNRNSASWILRYVRAGKERILGLGPIHTVGLAEARIRARAARLQLLDGIDPLEDRKAKKIAAKVAAAKTMTFEQCAKGYYDQHATKWKSARTRAQFLTSLAQHAFPVFGSLPVSVIDTGLVLQVLEPMWAGRTDLAQRVRTRIVNVLDWASVRGYRTGDNPARWKGHLAEALPARPKSKTKHHPALPYGELPQFMSELRAQKGTAARALEFTILTAVRAGETLGARWSEIDLPNATWTIPAERMKAGEAHRVPLSTRAVELLGELYREDGNPFVFIGGRGGLSTMAMPKVLRRMGRGDITTHGFRATFRTWCDEKTAFPHHVLEQALAHTIPSAVERAYRRSDLFEQRRRLMEMWATYSHGPVAAGEVVPLRASDA